MDRERILVRAACEKAVDDNKGINQDAGLWSEGFAPHLSISPERFDVF